MGSTSQPGHPSEQGGPFHLDDHPHVARPDLALDEGACVAAGHLGRRCTGPTQVGGTRESSKIGRRLGPPVGHHGSTRPGQGRTDDQQQRDQRRGVHARGPAFTPRHPGSRAATAVAESTAPGRCCSRPPGPTTSELTVTRTSVSVTTTANVAPGATACPREMA